MAVGSWRNGKKIGKESCHVLKALAGLLPLQLEKRMCMGPVIVGLLILTAISTQSSHDYKHVIETNVFVCYSVNNQIRSPTDQHHSMELGWLNPLTPAQSQSRLCMHTYIFPVGA